MSAGLFGLSVNQISVGIKPLFSKTLFWGAGYGQHLSGQSSGLSSLKRDYIHTDSKPGLFAPNFKDRMDEFNGTEAIGYCGPAEEPFYVRKSKVGSFSICFSGNIINCHELIDELTNDGHIFRREDDVEVMAKLIIQGKDIIDGIHRMAEKIKGAFALLILTPEGIYAARSPDGHWPLVIGENDKAATVSSESFGFNNLGFKRIRDVEPGEIVLLRNGTWRSKGKMPAGKVQGCSFYGAYTAFPSAIVHGLPASLIRKRLGASLAKRDIERRFIPHIVIPVPDSGRFHAIGYYQEFVRQMMLNNIKRLPFYDEYLIKCGIVRSFLAPSQRERGEKAYYKIVISSETIEHFIWMLEEAGLSDILEDIKSEGRLIIVVCDDSIVRGNQTESNLAPKIKIIFGRDDIKPEIHMRISYPELLSYCPYDKTTKTGELLTRRLPDKRDRIKQLGVSGLEHNTIDDLVRAIGCPREQLCIDCALPSKQVF